MPVAAAQRGRVLSALAQAAPDSSLEGGVRISRGGGWAWVSADEQAPRCRVVAEGPDAEFADELCGFCLDEIRRALQPDEAE